MPNKEYENKNYLLIGAANGFGATLACELAEDTANLLLIDHDKKLNSLCETLGLMTHCKGHLCDLMDYNHTIELLDDAVDDHGIDGLVYFTRGRQKYPYCELDDTKWHADFRLNVESVMHIVHHLWIKRKINKNASIVFLSSICGKLSGSESLSYNMSKSALESMCRYLATEMGPDHVRVNVLQLGFIVKDEHKDMFYSENNLDYRLCVEQIHPLSRVGHNEDVVGPIKFLLSDASSFITGQTICVDGGLTIQEQSNLILNSVFGKKEKVS